MSAPPFSNAAVHGQQASTRDDVLSDIRSAREWFESRIAQAVELATKPHQYGAREGLQFESVEIFGLQLAFAFNV